jgi:folate-binding protein YgfZ
MSGLELYRQIKTKGGAAILPRAVFKLTGSDRIRYLNGQVSNDVRKLTQGEVMYACVMTAKGRMCGDIFISLVGDDLLLDAEPSLRESLAARLEKYIISDDVTLEDVTDELSLIHVISDAPVDISGGDSLYIQKSRRFGRPGSDVFVSRNEAARVLATLTSNRPGIDAAMLETLRIEAGIPRWGFELDEDTIPVEAGLDKTAIDYNKGCYIGQEIISRLKSIGHVNRELRGFISMDGALPRPGMRLFLPGESAKDAGRITSAAYSFALEKPVALGYLKRGTTADTLNARSEEHPGGENDSLVLVKELPLIP